MGGHAAPAKTKDGKSVPKTVNMAAAFCAGFLEITIFHPFDTIAKRLMSHTNNIRGATSSETKANLNKVLFKKDADKPLFRRLASLYPGLVYGMCYKVLQRVYKFAGQPIVRDAMNKNGVGQTMKDKFGQKGGKLMTESVAGMMIGIGEIILLPLDRLKILSQTNDAALKNRSLLQIISTERFGMYAGAGVTAMRNAPGSFFLFGGTAFTKDVIFRVNENKPATVPQNFAASTVGGCLSIAVTNPMDVVKTRIQNKNFGESTTSGFIVRSIMREEGASAFFKGLTPKITASAPKLVFAYTATEYFASAFMKMRAPAVPEQPSK
jgi:hypothetical protein